jgi:hypothetical protein
VALVPDGGSPMVREGRRQIAGALVGLPGLVALGGLGAILVGQPARGVRIALGPRRGDGEQERDQQSEAGHSP